MSGIKERLYRELELKVKLVVDGLSVDPALFKRLDLGGTHSEQVHNCFEFDADVHEDFDLPAGFYLENGLPVMLRADKRSPYSLGFDNGAFHVLYKGQPVSKIQWPERSAYFAQTTSDGTPMSTIATDSGDHAIVVAYSNECMLGEKGKDCLFCNINATKATYGDRRGIGWKYPHQIGETVAAAYQGGARHVTVTGGFVPERREVDYYLDVAESIQEHLGREDFNGTACIGAPLDLDVIHKYQEAGYSTFAINIEVWNKHFFKAYCPGKDEYCGGYEHWIKALEYAAKVFGRGKVRSYMVGGLEPMRDSLDGIAYLADKGIIAVAQPWLPNPGSILERHRSPDPEWHLELAYKNAAILRNEGYTYEQLYNCTPVQFTAVHDIYKIENGLFPVFETENIEAASR